MRNAAIRVVFMMGLAFAAVACGDMTAGQGRGPVAGAPEWCPNAQDAVDQANGVPLTYPKPDGTAYPAPVYYDDCGTTDAASGLACEICWDNVRSAKVLLGGARCSQDTARPGIPAGNSPPPPPPPAAPIVICVPDCYDGCQ